MKTGTFLFLGTGGSAGVPLIGCTCPVCTSNDVRNQRWRTSGLLTLGEKKILIDSGPDFRGQALKFKINELDGVVLTHSHYDHIAGLDELRVYYLQTRKALPVLVPEPTWVDLKKRCAYLFQDKSQSLSLAAQLDFQVIHEARGTAEFLGEKFQFMQYEQAGMPVMGYRLGSFAYISDIRNYPETIFEDLSGVKALVLSSLRYEPSYLHFNIQEAIAFAQKAGAEKTYFTHLAHEIDHETASARLPKNIELGFDGLKLEFDYA